MNTAHNLALTLINTVKGLPKEMVNDRLLETVESAKENIITNLNYSLGLLATISSFHVEKLQQLSFEYRGFIAPEIVADLSDEIRHQLRMGFADGIDTYAKLMADPNYNYVLKSHLEEKGAQVIEHEVGDRR